MKNFNGQQLEFVWILRECDIVKMRKYPMANKEIIAIYGVSCSAYSPQYGNLTPYVLSNYIYLNVLLAG